MKDMRLTIINVEWWGMATLGGGFIILVYLWILFEIFHNKDFFLLPKLSSSIICKRCAIWLFCSVRGSFGLWPSPCVFHSPVICLQTKSCLVVQPGPSGSCIHTTMKSLLATLQTGRTVQTRSNENALSIPTNNTTQDGWALPPTP